MEDKGDNQATAVTPNGTTGIATFTAGERSVAALFDIDGVLVDSRSVHVDAWSRSFPDRGEDVEGWRIHRSIASGPTELLSSLLAVAALHLDSGATPPYAEHPFVTRKRLRAFREARALLHDLSERGVIVVLATSAPRSDLALIRNRLDAGDEADLAVVAHLRQEKWLPTDVVRSALKTAGVEPSRAIFIGDSIRDVSSARRAGVECIGVASGDSSPAQLLSAGAIAVYNDIASLRENVDISPLAALWA
ncbi:MAG: family hydrolase [Glaciihabitans sp.]|nr:family hydrolase [Glaciihabitans sp.]